MNKAKVLNESQLSVLNECEKKIERQLDINGPYSHNIVGMVLSRVADVCGIAIANELIEEYRLKEIFGINPVSEE